MRIVVILLYFFIPIIFCALIAYFFTYKRNINKKLQNQSYNDNYENGTNKRMPDFHSVAIVIVVVIIISSLSSANSNIDRLNNTVDVLSSEVSDLQIEVEDLKELMSYKNSIIEDIAVKYGNLNTDDNTANISFKITLKNKLKDAKYKLKISKNTIELKDGKNGCIEGNIDLNIFDCYEKMLIICEKADGETITEKISADDNPYEDCDYLLSEYLYENYMLNIYSERISSGTSIFKKGTTIEAKLGTENGFVDKSNKVTSARFVTEADGKILDEKKIEDTSKDVFEYSKYIETNKYDNVNCYLELTDNRGF